MNILYVVDIENCGSRKFYSAFHNFNRSVNDAKVSVISSFRCLSQKHYKKFLNKVESADKVNLHLFKKAKKNRADDNICRLLLKEDVNAYGVVFIVSKDRVLVEKIIDLLINKGCHPEVICPLWLHPALFRFNRKNLKRILNRWDKFILERLGGRIFTRDELTKTLSDFEALNKFDFITLVRLMVKHDRVLPFYGKEQYYIKKRCLELDFKVFNYK